MASGDCAPPVMGQPSSFKITKTLLVARSWQRLPAVVHGFSTRHSSRRDFFARVASEEKELRPVELRQIHSATVRTIDVVPERLPVGDAPVGDAMVTATAGLALAVKTADCPPILLLDPVARAVGIVHAGWRGTVCRITEKTVGTMRAHYRADPTRMRAVIGPGIHACCYQVGEEVLEQFRSQFPYAEELFSGLDPDNPADTLLPRQIMRDRISIMRILNPATAYLDLEEANRRQLLAAGLRKKNIVTGAPCTACRTDLLYSYRREGTAAGRLYAMIALRAT